MQRLLLILLSICMLTATASDAETVTADHGNSSQNGDRTLTPSRLIANKCVFILATGHSGSTGLMDALNQLPHYLIRGEQWAAFWNVYESYMNFRWTVVEPSQARFNWTSYHNASLETVKRLYDQYAPRAKLAWFNEFPQDRILAASQAYYAVLYGYYGQDFVSGFKDSRYVCGKSFQSGRCAEFFSGFMLFLRTLCLNVKILLNTRSSPSIEANAKLYDTDRGRHEEEFARDLNKTHFLYDKYAARNPAHAFRVFYEDMTNPSTNATLAHKLLEWLGEDPTTPIRFNRVPPANTRGV